MELQFYVFSFSIKERSGFLIFFLFFSPPVQELLRLRSGRIFYHLFWWRRCKLSRRRTRNVCIDKWINCMALVCIIYYWSVVLFELDGTIRPLSLLVHCCSLLYSAITWFQRRSGRMDWEWNGNLQEYVHLIYKHIIIISEWCKWGRNSVIVGRESGT